MIIKEIKEHEVEVSFHNGKYFLWSSMFKEYASSSSREKLFKEYVASLKRLVESYGIEDDSKLSDKAIEFKNKINEYIKYDIKE